MSTAFPRLVSTAAFLLVAALLAFSPRIAGAHGGHARESVPPAAAEARAEIAAQPPGDQALERVQAPLVSAPCPGQSGSSCCCGGGAGSIGDGRLPLAGCTGSVVPAPPAVGQSHVPFQRLLAEPRPLPSASPRGPPPLS